MTKKNMALILILLFFLTLSGCIVVDGTTAPAPQPPPSHEKSAPPDWAPAPGHRVKYNYRYYPSQSIYYDTGRRLYFYTRNGIWTVAVSLPGDIRLSNEYVIFDMDTDRPYTRHSEIRKKYPPARHVKYNYRYYPSQSIYYDTGRKLYFFERNGSWTVAVSLPGNIRLRVDDYVNFEMDTDRPYTRHNEIRKKYPPGKQKKHIRAKNKPVPERHVKYNYRYYPSQSIYYDTGRKLYFFERNGSWTVAVSLPGNIRLRVDDYVNFEMDTDRPYTRHNEIREKYPPLQQKKPAIRKDVKGNKNKYEDGTQGKHDDKDLAKNKPIPARHAKYNYRYYLSQSIYYDTGRKLYFFERNGSWTVSGSLPGNIKLSVNDYVTFEMDTDKPYTRHSEIRKKYPPGQQKKTNREKGNIGNKDKYKDKQRDKN